MSVCVRVRMYIDLCASTYNMYKIYREFLTCIRKTHKTIPTYLHYYVLYVLDKLISSITADLQSSTFPLLNIK